MFLFRTFFFRNPQGASWWWWLVVSCCRLPELWRVKSWELFIVQPRVLLLFEAGSNRLFGQGFSSGVAPIRCAASPARLSWRWPRCDRWIRICSRPLFAKELLLLLLFSRSFWQAFRSNGFPGHHLLSCRHFRYLSKSYILDFVFAYQDLSNSSGSTSWAWYQATSPTSVGQKRLSWITIITFNCC